MGQDIQISARSLDLADLDFLFEKLAVGGNELGRAVQGMGRAIDALTHGHGGFDLGQLAQEERFIAASLPSGFRVESIEAKLGEHQMRALGARVVNILSESGDSCRAEWGGPGTRLTLTISKNFSPSDFGLFLQRSDPVLGDQYSLEPDGPPKIIVKRASD